MNLSRKPSFKKLLGFSIASLFVFSLFSYFSAAAAIEIPNSRENYILPFSEDLYAMLNGKQLLTSGIKKTLYGEKKVGVLCRSSPVDNKITAVEESCIPNELIERVREESQPWYWFNKEVPGYLSCLEKANKELTFYLFGEECKAICTFDSQYGVELNGEISRGLTAKLSERKRLAPVTIKNCVESNYVIDILRDDLNGDDLFYLVPCKKDKNKPKVTGVTNLCVYQTWIQSLFKEEQLVLQIHEDVIRNQGKYFKKVLIPEERPITAKFFSEKLGGAFEKEFLISGEISALYCRKNWCLKTFLNKGALNAVLSKVDSITPGNQLSATSYTDI